MNITNLVIMAALTNCSDFCKKLDLPIALPITLEQVKSAKIAELYPNVEVFLKLKDGHNFHTANSCVEFYFDPKSFVGRFPYKSDFDQVATMTQSEALAFARQSVTNLGYSLDGFYMNLEPDIKPYDFHLPDYTFTWKRPNFSDAPSIELEINTCKRELVYLVIFGMMKDSGNSLKIPGLDQLIEADRRRQVATYFPKIPLDLPKSDTQETLEALAKIKPFALALSLPITKPDSMQEVQTVQVSYKSGMPELIVLYKNGYVFSYSLNSKRVESFSAGDYFFNTFKNLNLANFTGESKMSDKEAMILVTNSVAKLNCNMAGLFSREPEVERPNIHQNLSVPRIFFRWDQVNNEGWLQKAVTAEVDTQTGRLVSLSVYGCK